MSASVLKEFAQLLRSIKVKFLILGGYAPAVFGCSSFISNSSFWSGTNFGNAEKIVKTLRESGFGSLLLTARDFKISKVVAGQPAGLADLGSLR